MTSALETARLRLRPANVDDAQAIFDAYASDPEATRFLAFKTLTHASEAAAYLETVAAARAAGAVETWVITLRESGLVIGAIDLRINGSAGDIGYAIGKHWWGNGFVAEAARAVLGFAEESLRLKRVTGMCDAENLASARVFEKLGFRPVRCDTRAVHPNLGPDPRPVLCFERILARPAS